MANRGNFGSYGDSYGSYQGPASGMGSQGRYCEAS